jgi:LacI family transcriptional regulator
VPGAGCRHGGIRDIVAPIGMRGGPRGSPVLAATIKEIALACGVSRGTVDRALNNKGGVNARTKKKVLQAARRLDYRPHYIARSLIRGKTFSIGIVVFDLFNSFLSQFIEAAESRARELGFFSYLTLTEKDRGIEKSCLAHLADRKVDGIVLLPVNRGPSFETFLRGLKIPLVTVGNRVSARWHFVGIDDLQASRDAVEHIFSRGYARVVYVSPPLALGGGSANIYAPEQRYRGFTLAMEARRPGQAPLVITSKDYSLLLGELERARGERVAVFCSSDVFAIGVLDFLYGRGIRVPEDVGVMGFDRIDSLKHIRPSLATVDQRVDEQGARAVDDLVALIGGSEAPPLRLIHHEIVPGASL